MYKIRITLYGKSTSDGNVYKTLEEAQNLCNDMNIALKRLGVKEDLCDVIPV